MGLFDRCVSAQLCCITASDKHVMGRDSSGNPSLEPNFVDFL
jgi:hypothetical protein